MRKAAKAGLIVVGVLVALVIAAAVFLAVFDWSRATGFVAAQASARLDREVTLGDLEVELGWPPRVRLHDLTIANIDGGSRPTMARIDTLDFSLRLLPLLWGRVVLPDIALGRPDVLLERTRDGLANWMFGEEDEEPGEPPVIGQLHVDNGKLGFRLPTSKTDIQIDLATKVAKEGSEPRLHVEGTGRYRGAPFSLRGQGGSLLALRDEEDPYPLDVQARAGGTRARAEGTLVDPLNLRGIDVDLRLQGADLARLNDFIGLPLPATPPYRLDGHLRREGQTWQFANFNGRVGDSDLAGYVSVDLAEARPMLRADLTSTRLDFDDLAPFVGAPPRTGAGETGSAAQRREAARLAQRDQILPDKEYDLQRLRAIDADVRLNAKRISAPGLPLDDLETHLRLDNGVLTLQPLNFGVAGGNLVSEITLDARAAQIKTSADVTARGVLLRRLFPDVKLAEGEGTLGGRMRVQTTGNSIAEMATAADGNLGLAMRRGEINKMLVALASLNVQKVIEAFLGDAKKVQIRCGAAALDIIDGVMQTETLVLATEDTNFIGEGKVALGSEKLDLTIHPQPQEAGAPSLRAPLHIRGTFKEPDIAIDQSAIARAGAAVALGTVVGPLAALVPLVETGPGEPKDCGPLLADARRAASESPKSKQPQSK